MNGSASVVFLQSHSHPDLCPASPAGLPLVSLREAVKELVSVFRWRFRARTVRGADKRTARFYCFVLLVNFSHFPPLLGDSSSFLFSPGRAGAGCPRLPILRPQQEWRGWGAGPEAHRDPWATAAGLGHPLIRAQGLSLSRLAVTPPRPQPRLSNLFAVCFL